MFQALLRMTLRKVPGARNEEDLEFIFNELLHIKALAQTSTSIKRELAKVVLLESHSAAGTICKCSWDESTRLGLTKAASVISSRLVFLKHISSNHFRSWCLLIVFSQGDEGTSWYIILKGSVNVVIYGKVCELLI